MPPVGESRVIELFSSIQGEGPYIGYRQAFLRLAGCNIKCSYCDTPNDPGEQWRWEKTPGTGVFEFLANPATVDDIVRCLHSYEPSRHHSLSITGGEPLLQAGFLQLFLPEIHKSWPVYLETNGTLPEALGEVIDYCTYISMDLKLPEDTGKNFFAQHEEFIKICSNKELFIKIVVSGNMTEGWQQAIYLLEQVGRQIPLIIQPATGQNVPPVKILAMQEYAQKRLKNVRVIPQAHVMLNLL